MRVDNVNQNKKKKGKFIVDDQEEIDLILESMQKLIKKQEKNVDIKHGGGIVEREKLARYKKTKNTMEFVRPPPKKKDKKLPPGGLLAEVPELIEGGGEGLGGTEVTYNDMYDIINALNEHIYSYEKDGTYQEENEQKKYNKLVKLLEQAQNQKAQFERVTPKPRGFGRLRK